MPCCRVSDEALQAGARVWVVKMQRVVCSCASFWAVPCWAQNQVSNVHLRQLIVNHPHHVAAGSQIEPAKQLTEFVVYLVRKNKGADRNIPPPGLSDPSVMSSAFFLLLQLLQPYMEGRAGHEGSLSSFPAGAMFLGVCTLPCRLMHSSVQMCWKCGFAASRMTVDGFHPARPLEICLLSSQLHISVLTCT